MKKIIILLLIGIPSSCETKINSETKKSVDLTETQKQADIDSVKGLVTHSFQDIFSNLDSTAVSKYYTTDFILLENGAVWNNDSILHYTTKNTMKKQGIKRLNRFEYVKSVHNKNSIWLAYDNYAAFVKGKDTLGRAHWMESVIAVKEDQTWKLQQLHSTIVRD
ncbi:nuclear transport factor 2 family protein [Mesonia sp. MT50]|uniref:Nuclear transport factor 2 family protein n=1 Tax=Mesonia profundi TaxID=3070998 RepID=A0ABU1A3V1_9FLAO|nr:nuclear transport factor 2 family protein [Mesonia profundi]MDQ7918383.1 nuclear transport factor 2 family protein [Mesonia profundi]